MIKTLNLCISGLALAGLVLSTTACGEQNRRLEPRRGGAWNPTTHHQRGHLPNGRITGQLPMGSNSHHVGQVTGGISASLEGAQLLAQTELTSLGGVFFKGAIETYSGNPTGGYISLAIYDAAEAPVYTANFNLVDGTISQPQARVILEGQYGQLVLDGSMSGGSPSTDMFSGQASLALDGGQLQHLGRFEILTCGFFTCR